VDEVIGSVINTAEQFIAGVVDTGDNIFPGCCLYRSEITKKPKIYYRCQRDRWKISRRCQQHRRLESPASISLPAPEYEKLAKIQSLGVKCTEPSS
jgi:hypothetical protein